MVPDWTGLAPQAALVAAESFSVDSWQRVHLHNLVDGLIVARLPARRRLCGCAKVWALPPGEHQARLLLVDPDGQVLGAGPLTALRPLAGLTSCTVLAAFAGVPLRKTGRHELALEIDRRTLATLPLEVVVGRAPGEGEG